MGKANIGTNTKAPLKAVYILERAKENRAARVLPSQVLRQLIVVAVFVVVRSRMERLKQQKKMLNGAERKDCLNCSTGVSV